MKRRRVVIGVVAGLALAALGAGSSVHAAAAGIVAGCSGSWSLSLPTQQAECSFVAAYDPSDASTGNYELTADLGTGWNWTQVGPVFLSPQAASIRVVDDSGDVLATCVVGGSGVCGTVTFSSAPEVPAGTVLHCIVQGRGSGDYRCGTG